MKRLTKAALTAYIRGQIQHRLDFDFDPDKDVHQVLGGGETANRHYGRFQALLDLAKEFGVDPYAKAPTPRQKRAKAKPGTLANDMRALRGYGQTEGYMKAIREGRGP
jgi:hypothetical protein